ncbi:MAG: DUF58 domain-containing protein [Gemmatimonadaceae bacterium]|nr:DUF58 domain-containing protein [Gemmatimonadaceae bacterium]
MLWIVPGIGSLLGATALGAIALGVVIDLFRLPSRHSFRIAREAPESTGLGDDAAISYRFTNATAMPLRALAQDRLPPCVAGGLGTTRLVVAAHSTTSVEVPLRGIKRAEDVLGPVGVRLTTSLGLVGVRIRATPEDRIRVLPSVAGVRRFRLLLMQHRLETAGVRLQRLRGEGQGFAGLREYVVGDDVRHIDWKATAKRSKPITREYTIERAQTVLTLIDAGRGMTQLAGDFSRFEQALASALILTDVAVMAGDRVGTMVFDDKVRAFVPAHRSRGALRDVRDAFVPVTASTVEPDYASAFRFLAAQQRRRALIVLYSDVLGVRASRALIAHVSRSSARHLVLVVALRNDPLHALAVPRAETSDTELYATAAAAEMLESREEALERMRRAGAVVLDVSPEVMTASVINRYLELKARGSL